MTLNGTYRFATTLSGMTNLLDADGAIIASIVKGPNAGRITVMFMDAITKGGGSLHDESGTCLVGTLDQIAA